MSILARVRQGFGLIRRRDRLEADWRKEVAFHLQMEIDQRIAAGLSPDEARRTALVDFGGVDRSTEEVRDVRGVTFWDNVMQDIRLGVRSLRRSPGYTLAAVVTLGLGIGANTAIFGVLNGVLLHPLPYADSSRLVRIRQDQPLRNQTNIGVAISEVWDYRRNLKTIDDVVEYHQMTFTLFDKGEADRILAGVVSSTYFDAFGVKPLFGRTFRESDDVLGANPVLVLSNHYWLKHFGGDEHVVGKNVEMNDKVHTIVGVLPPIPGYPQDSDVYMPTSACPFRAAAELTIANRRRAFPGLRAFGRLKPGVSLAEANADVAAVARTFVDARPDVYERASTGFQANLVQLEGEITEQARPIVWSLLGATALVLLIACANVANLALSRTLRRDRELALRTALGARRSRLVRQLLTESTIVALIGGVLGVALAWATSGMLAAFAGLFTPRAVDASVDGTVLLFALAASLLTGIGFGALPAMASRPTLVGSLKDGAAQAGDTRPGLRLRSGLVVAQVALGFALVTAAGLLLQSLYHLSTAELGYRDADKVLAAEVYGNFSTEMTVQDALRLYAGVLARARAIPGVTGVAVSNAVPQSNISPGPQTLWIRGQGERDIASASKVDQNIATEDYFRILGVPILAGRAFTSADRGDDGQLVAVINQTMANLWGKANPIGTTFIAGTPGPSSGRPPRPYNVVGIAGDVRQYGIDHPAIAEFYTPLLQLPRITTNFVGMQVLVRTSGDAALLASALRQAVREVDPQVPVENVQTLEQLRESKLTTRKLGAFLLLVFASFALLITLGGLGAVIATTVSRRTREFGLRMALGASRRSVLVMVLTQAAWMVGAGLVVGVGAATLCGRALQSYLYQTPPTAPLIYALVAALFVVAGLFACLGPARRATSIDPLSALRAE
jgi:predicted permease